MKEFLKKWLFKDDIERNEWYFERRKNQLERDYQDRANYLEMSYAMMEHENKHLHKVIGDYLALTPGSPLIFNSTSDGDSSGS